MTPPPPHIILLFTILVINQLHCIYDMRDNKKENEKKKKIHASMHKKTSFFFGLFMIYVKCFKYFLAYIYIATNEMNDNINKLL